MSDPCDDCVWPELTLPACGYFVLREPLPADEPGGEKASGPCCGHCNWPGKRKPCGWSRLEKGHDEPSEFWDPELALPVPNPPQARPRPCLDGLAGQSQRVLRLVRSRRNAGRAVRTTVSTVRNAGGR